MKSSSIGIKSIFVVVLVFACLIPINVFARGGFYIAFKPGIYSPQSSDLDGFDTGFNGEIAFGYRFNPNIAAEFGIGYFNTEGEETVGGTYVGRDFDIDVYPITFTFKAILPYKKWEFFGLAGGGVYITYGPYNDYDYDYDNHHYHDYYYYDYDDYDYDVRLGGYLGAGIHYNITRKIFVGVEGKYLWTDKVKLEDLGLKFNMDGIIATAVFGIRF